MKSYIYTLALMILVGMSHSVNAEVNYVSSRNNTQGDHLQFTTDVYGFIPVSALADKTPRCAGKYTKFAIVHADENDTTVKFYSVTAPISNDTCPKETARPSEGSLYTMPNKQFALLEYKSTGVAFGALVVPFKFRVGSDSQLVSSATIAPYLGFRWAKLQGFSVELIPVVAAGIALVPVTDPETKASSTRSAFSTAIGVTLVSSKDINFSAGVLVGKDFLGKADRALDPAANDPWISIWLGVSK